jgi:hypothetical protein
MTRTETTILLFEIARFCFLLVNVKVAVGGHNTSLTRCLTRHTSSTVVRLSGFIANSRCEHHLWRPYVTFV